MTALIDAIAKAGAAYLYALKFSPEISDVFQHAGGVEQRRGELVALLDAYAAPAPAPVQSCSQCAHWKLPAPGRSRGECDAPLPSFVVLHDLHDAETLPNAGKTCPTFKRYEGAPR